MYGATSRFIAVSANGKLDREVLGVPAVGVKDSFFDLGGPSLFVVQVHRRLGLEACEALFASLGLTGSFWALREQTPCEPRRIHG